MNKTTEYRIAGASGTDGTAAWAENARAPLTEDDQMQMDRYGITRQQAPVYGYRGHVYHRLSDALAYARIATSRPRD